MVKILRIKALLVDISRFKVKSTKNKVNNENVSDVNTDKTTDNAIIADKKREIKLIPKCIGFSVLL